MILVGAKFGIALLGAVLLSGCEDLGTVGSMSLLEGSDGAGIELVSTARLAMGRVTVSGPDGYCIDPATLRASGRNGFAAIASCHILSDGAQGPVVEPVLVTVAVSPVPDTTPTLDDMATALGTELLQRRELSGLEVGQLASGGQTAFSGSDPRHWRGLFVLGPNLIGVTLYAPQGSPLLGAQGAAFLNTVSSRIRAMSRQSPTSSAEQSQSTVDPFAARLGRLFERRDL